MATKESYLFPFNTWMAEISGGMFIGGPCQTAQGTLWLKVTFSEGGTEMWTKQGQVKLYFRPLLKFTLAKKVREKKVRIFFLVTTDILTARGYCGKTISLDLSLFHISQSSSVGGKIN